MMESKAKYMKKSQEILKIFFKFSKVPLKKS